jgi:peptidoglycan/LPS O-acetylase OafA/YrhL
MSTVTPVGQAAIIPRFPVLDTMRAVGALAVLTTHTAFWGGEYTRHGAFGTLLARLDVGVAIFFVLSGFLLSYPYLARAQRHESAPKLRPYLWKRFLRIYPVYTLTMILALGLIEGNRDASVGDWLTTTLLGDLYVHRQLPQGLTQMWSLAVEVSFYLVLPTLMLAATGRRRLRVRRVVVLLTVMTAVDVLWHLVATPWLDGRVGGSPLQWLPSYLLWFAVGIGLSLARVLHDHHVAPGRFRRALTSLAALPGSCWALAGGVMLVAATPLAGPSMLAPPSPAESLTKNVLYAGVGLLLVLPGVFGTGAGLFTTVFSLAPMRHLGVISYGVFCLHLPVLHLVMHLTGYQLFRGHGWQIWVLTLVISVAAAEVVYRLVERPAMRLRLRGSWGAQGSDSTTVPMTGTSTR